MTFSLKSTAETKGVETVGRVIFNWEASPNKDSYDALPMKDVKSEAKVGDAAKLTLAVSPQKGKATLTGACDQPSVFYFALATSNDTLSTMTWSDIKAKSLDAGI